jgi:hypothetical protein
MKLTNLLTLAFAISLVASQAARSADTDLERLLKRVPSDMNTLAVIQVAKINKSPRAVKEGWGKKNHLEYVSGSMVVPPSASMVLIAGDITPDNIANGKIIGMMPVEQFVTMGDLANKENGTIETISGCTAVLSPRSGYIAQLPQRILSANRNMNRQEFARWLQFAKSNDQMVLSKYLSQAALENKESDIVIAYDMTEMLDPITVKAEVAHSGLVSEGQDGMVKILSGIRGMTLTMNFEDKTKSRLRIDFANDLGAFSKIMPKFVTHIMGELGAEIEEFKNGDWKSEKNSVALDTELSDQSLRRILSLLLSPRSLNLVGAASENPEKTAAFAASLRYFKAIDMHLADLKKIVNAKQKQPDYAKTALWYDTYANKISQMPITDIDPELVKYGYSVSSKLRGLAGSLRGVRMQLENYENYTSTEYIATGGWGGGGAAISSNVPEIRVKQAELANSLAPEREKVWKVIDDDRETVRQKMAEKYKVDFAQVK